jgi:lysyl-tRNA synthetase class 2
LSTRHNPEFTILELYQAYATYEDAMGLTENLLRQLTRALLGTTVVDYQGETFDLREPFAKTTLEAQLQATHASLEGAAVRDRAELAALCRQSGFEVLDTHGPGKLQFELFEKTVESQLKGPVFVTQFPAEVSPLARANETDSFLTDRFELFIGGRELANGFSELNDPEDQAARFHAQLEARRQGDDEAMRYDDDYIRALEYGMAPAAGLGIGVDRLVMLFTDSPSIRDVLLFPQLKHEA